MNKLHEKELSEFEDSISTGEIKKVSKKDIKYLLKTSPQMLSKIKTSLSFLKMSIKKIQFRGYRNRNKKLMGISKEDI